MTFWRTTKETASPNCMEGGGVRGKIVVLHPQHEKEEGGRKSQTQTKQHSHNMLEGQLQSLYRSRVD